MKKWKCECGYIHDGVEPVMRCPKCGAAGEKLILMDHDAANLVERSRKTNSWHCGLVDLGRQLEELCKAGIEDNLDPGCVDVFKKSLAHSYEIMKLSMTEIQGHMAKSKWG